MIEIFTSIAAFFLGVFVGVGASVAIVIVAARTATQTIRAQREEEAMKDKHDKFTQEIPFSFGAPLIIVPRDPDATATDQYAWHRQDPAPEIRKASKSSSVPCRPCAEIRKKAADFLARVRRGHTGSRLK